VIRPPALGPAPRVALVAPAGPLAPGAVDRAVARLEAWGWTPLLGRHARGRSGFLSGSDAERLEDFDQALRDPHNDAIWCLRGGYGTMRIVDAIDWAALAARPRPLIGFSDNTVLHLAASRAGIVSFHGPHPAAEEFPDFASHGLRDMLHGRRPAGPLPFPPGGGGRAATLVGGVAEGPLVGGNLSLLSATLGTPYALRTEGAILFLEEVGEPAYRIDRLLSHLRLAGVLERVAGVIIGGFTECPDEEDDGIPRPEQVLAAQLSRLGVPVATGFPFGHVPDNWTLPVGVRARLDADAGTLTLLEPATRPT
jgi:muramoyltetrapeptide carboxypeptidase